MKNESYVHTNDYPPSRPNLVITRRIGAAYWYSQVRERFQEITFSAEKALVEDIASCDAMYSGDIIYLLRV